ncbi:MAG: exodeoxyribonuclease V subunit gamma, partial [Actinomycetota bacterium]|nr:exodeoxyribonuclease V subunit gamma [Actinomycetota bacterium]
AGADVPDLPPRMSLFGLTALPASYVAVLAALATHRDIHLFLLHPSPVLWQRVAQHPQRRLPTPVRREDDPTREAPRHPLLASWGRDSRELQLVVGSPAAGAGDEHRPFPGPEPATLLGLIQAGVRADRPPPGLPLGGHHDDRPLLTAEDRSLQVHACHGRTRQVEVLRDAILHLLAEDRTLEPRDVVVMCPDIETFAPIVHAVFGAPARPTPEATGFALASDDVSGEGGRERRSAGATREESSWVSQDGDGSGHERRSAGATREELSRVSQDGDGSGQETTGGHATRRNLPDLRVRLADRALRQTNPVLRVVAELLTLAEGRLTASEVLGFAAGEPVRRRFRFGDDDLQRLEAWVAEARIRWGLDAEHRAAFGLPGVAANTWRAGIERLLVGVTMADEDQRLVAGIAPLDDVEGDAVDLAGRFAEFVHRLGASLATFTAPQPTADWRDAIAVAADRLTLTSERDRWQQVQLHRLLDDVVAEATLDSASSPIELTLSEVRSLLEERLRGRPSRANHRTGDLTVCTLVPMRSVPHRVICLLGLDDAAFPRRTAPDGDDLIAVTPQVGDRDPRTEDRQLLLDALLAATDHLVITYSGRDERTNAPHPPAVPIGELLDVIDRTARTDVADVPARARVLVEHPLQTFDPRNFRVGELIPERPWGFDATALAGAEAKVRGQAEPAPFLVTPLPPERTATIELAELVRFLEHPVKAFLRRRLGIRLPTPSEQATDSLPVELDSLERFAVGERLLAARLAGTEEARWLAVERARGSLPPGALADGLINDLTATVAALLAAAVEHAELDPAHENLEAILPLPGGRTLVGAVPVAGPDLLLTVQYARVSARHRLAAWARLLAVSAAHPGRRLLAVTVGRSAARKAKVRIARLPQLAGDPRARHQTAIGHLVRLVDLYERGMREPLPLYCETSAAYAEAVRAGHDEPLAAAAESWATGRQRWPNEDLHPEHVLVHGGVLAFDALCGPVPREDEQGEGWPHDESTRFGRYARRLWDALLAVEEIEDR